MTPAESTPTDMGAIQRVAGTLPLAFDPDYSPARGFLGPRRVTFGRSRVRESRTLGSVGAKAKWLSYPTPRERLECLREMLRLIPKHKGTDHLQGDIKRRIKERSGERGYESTAAADEEDPFALRLPTLLLANKADSLAEADAEIRAFLEVTGLRYPALAVSATTGYGLGHIGPWLFGHLDVARVYAKAPGRPPDRHRPFILHRGQTVEDVARLVHKDLAQSLKYARVWGKTAFDGQHVGRDHPVADGDVVELHV